MMKEKIRANLDNPKQLEKMYRSDKTKFKKTFVALYPTLQGNLLADGWHERLNYESEEINWGNRNDLLFVVIASAIAGTIAKLPVILSVTEDSFYSRNVGFIVFPLLTFYFAWRNKLPMRKMLFIACSILVSIIYINSLPDSNKSDTLVLACMHMVLFLWSILGFAFVGGKHNDKEKRLAFLKYNGDLIVMTGLIGIAGAILTGITFGLFSLIGFDIKTFYFENVAIYGLAAAPIVATFLTQTNPQLVGKVAPVIAKLFSPLVLVMLVAYLIAIWYSGKDPYNDRDFLLLFNALLAGVMAIIFFSVAESNGSQRKIETWILLLLSVVTITVNGVALSAILFRISEFGITPNRVVVLGSNILMLVNLIWVATALGKRISKNADMQSVENAIASYLPLYVIWAAVVTFLFPVVFAFR